MKLCASYQVQCWQTVLCFEIRFFAKRQNVTSKCRRTVNRQETEFKNVNLRPKRIDNINGK